MLSEVQGNTFEVAGPPNTKVSWTVYADRNDPYLQQNPEVSADVVVKTGERQGKYLNPELYGMPDSSAMFPKSETQAASQKNPSATQAGNANVQQIRQEAANTQTLQLQTGTGSSSEQ